ncbi:MAG: ABC transporter ATP-binding protein [Burkholderiales bacterium]
MLEVRGLNAGYGRARVLFDVAFEVGAGEVLALLGRNGAGKSTTLKSLVGLTAERRLEATLDGERIDRLPTHRIARLGLAYVPEERRIFTELTVLENLNLGRRPAQAGAPPWTAERVMRLFPELASLQDRPGGRLSGGEQQMLALSRALMGNPRVLLLDEPAEGLAPVVVSRLLGTLRELKAQGLGIVLAEQGLAFASRIADRACLLERGRIRATGAFASVRSQYASG